MSMLNTLGSWKVWGHYVEMGHFRTYKLLKSLKSLKVKHYDYRETFYKNFHPKKTASLV